MVVEALDLAHLRRNLHSTIIHSDHGPRCCSWVFGQHLRQAELLGSMGTIDNAASELFFASLQCELLDLH